MKQLALSILLKPRAIAIPSRHNRSLAARWRLRLYPFEQVRTRQPDYADGGAEERTAVVPMTAVWIVVGVGVTLVLAIWFSRGESDGSTDGGFVSNHWIAEHRASDMHDPGSK